MTGTPSSSRTGGLVPIFDQTLLADAAAIDTGADAIPAAYSHLMIVTLFRTAQAATAGSVDVTFNADAGANYDKEEGNAIDATASAASTAAASAIRIPAAGNTLPAGVFQAGSYFLPAYRQTTAHKALEGLSGRASETVAADQVTTTGGRWRNAAAITRLTFTGVGPSNLLAGSRVTIYGMV